MDEQIRQDESTGGYGERDGHQRHRPLSRLDLGLTHDREAVGDGFDPGVRPPTQGIRADEQCHHPDKTEPHGRCLEALRESAMHLIENGRDVAEASDDDAADEDRVTDQKNHEERGERDHRFLHAPKIQDNEEADRRELHEQLDRQEAEHHSARPSRRQETENGVASRRN